MFIHFLDEGERALADKGYKNYNFFKNPSNKKEKTVLARHETVNGRIKEFNILKNCFRNSLHKHPNTFHAIINLTQLAIKDGEKLFDIL